MLSFRFITNRLQISCYRFLEYILLNSPPAFMIDRQLINACIPEYVPIKFLRLVTVISCHASLNNPAVQMFAWLRISKVKIVTDIHMRDAYRRYFMSRVASFLGVCPV